MSTMPTTYRGKLTPEQRALVDDHDPLSGRQIAAQLGLTYGQVRGYLEWRNRQQSPLTKAPATGPKILVFDIETAPYRSYTWGLWKQNVIDIEREWFMLSFAYGWYDLKRQTLGPIDFVSCQQDPKFKGGSDNDNLVSMRLWDLFDQAEVIVGQNHERFDIKKANERFFVHGKTPPAPYATIDTKRVWNQNFSGSASLKYMARKADVALKQSNRGFELWLDCMNNLDVGWTEMESYNRADVQATAEVFTRLIPWINPKVSRQVNFGLWTTGKFSCTNCGNTEDEFGFQKRGFHGTGASRFQTYLCKKCGAYPRDYQRIPQRHEDDKTFTR